MTFSAAFADAAAEAAAAATAGLRGGIADCWTLLARAVACCSCSCCVGIALACWARVACCGFACFHQMTRSLTCFMSWSRLRWLSVWTEW